VNTPATRALAVFGWSPEAAEALAALTSTPASTDVSGRFRAVGVTDPSGAALVQARRDTGLPCFQQVRQFLAAAEYDALLIATPQSAAVATLAASRGADLLLLAAARDVGTLEAAAEAARRHGVRLSLLRPEAHDAGVADLVRLLASSPDWRPSYLDITVEGPTDIDRLLGTAVAHATSLARVTDALVHARAWSESDGAPARVITATLEARGREIRVTARHAPDAFLRITGDAPAGAFDLRVAAGEASLSSTTCAREQTRYRPEWLDHWVIETARATSADDVTPARAQASVLGAVARAIVTGEVQTTDCYARPELRIIEGRGIAHPRRGNLRLVVN